MNPSPLRVVLIGPRAVALQPQLVAAGVTVTTAKTEQGVAKALRDHPGVVLLSGLSSVDGLALLKSLRARDFSNPAILLFDEPDNSSSVAAAALGAVQCLVTPIKIETLRRAVAFAVSTPAPDAASARQGRVTFRSRLRGPLVPASISATEAKNEFGRVLDAALQTGAVVITRHQAPKAVLLALDEFQDLVSESAQGLEALSAEFDEVLLRMQDPGARGRMKAAFAADPVELGRAAVVAARKRG